MAVPFLALAALFGSIAAGPCVAAVMPDEGSPLASDGFWLYAVTNGQAVISRPLGTESSWRLLGSPAFGRVVGLAAASNALFVADGVTNEVTRLTPGVGQRSDIRPSGISLADIAYAGALFAVDSSTGNIVRMAGKDATFPVALPSFHGPTRTFLASDGVSLVVSHPDQGDIHHIPNASESQPTARVVYRKEDAGKIVPTGDALGWSSSTAQGRSFPVIQQPGRVSLYRGIVYTVDEADGALYAMSRHLPPRPVRCVLQLNLWPLLSQRPSPPVHVTSIFAHAGALTVIARGRTTKDWPRIVPTELVVKATDQSAALSLVYHYLFGRGILPTRSVVAAEDLVTTLARHEVFADPNTPANSQLLCLLNRQHCSSGRVRVPTGGAIIVPDVNFERFIKLVESDAPNVEAAVAQASREVRTHAFVGTWTDATAIREQNPSWQLDMQRTGPLLVPAEFVRYLAPMSAEDVPTPGPPPSGDETLQDLEAQGLIQIISLEEVTPAPASNATIANLSEPWLTLQSAFDTIARTISYEDLAPEPNLLRTAVGIAEDKVDPSHPDFWAGNECAFAAYPGGLPKVAASVQVERLPKTRLETSDHGTMTASAIAARQTRFGRKGFAPRTILHYVNSSGGRIGRDINDAALGTARIFNLSISFPRMPKDLTEPLENTSYLFVVAAGKYDSAEKGQLCVEPIVYPACHVSHPNMIVVTATTAEGDRLVMPTPTTPGANWSVQRVDVAAPGEGFYLAASPGTYAPADGGSSFAVPLVTATAATLFEQGVTRPASIRERIIATADPRPDLVGKVRGGLLNVRRAIRHPHEGVINDTTKCRIKPDEMIQISQVAGPPLHLAMRQILRLHTYGRHMRLVYTWDGAIHVVDDAYFETEDASRFTCVAEDGTKSGQFLEGVWDYVGPTGQ